MRQVCEQGEKAARRGLGLAKQHRPAQAAIKEEKNQSQPPSRLASRKLPGKPNKERHQRKGDEHILEEKSSRERKPKFDQERPMEIHDERIGQLYARHRGMLYRKVFSEDKTVD